MSVTHVMADVDAVGCFPKWRHWMPSDGVEGQMDPPTVKWIVMAEPLVCPTCNGLGWLTADVAIDWATKTFDGDVDCPDCNGTGRPDVEIQSRCKDAQCGCGETGFIIHGVVTIGPALPIVDFNTCRSPKPRHVCVGDLTDLGIPGNGVIHVTNMHDVARNITDEFGTQSVTPGKWAHPVLQATP